MSLSEKNRRPTPAAIRNDWTPGGLLVIAIFTIGIYYAQDTATLNFWRATLGFAKSSESSPEVASAELPHEGGDAIQNLELRDPEGSARLQSELPSEHESSSASETNFLPAVRPRRPAPARLQPDASLADAEPLLDERFDSTEQTAAVRGPHARARAARPLQVQTASLEEASTVDAELDTIDQDLITDADFSGTLSQAESGPAPGTITASAPPTRRTSSRQVGSPVQLTAAEESVPSASSGTSSGKSNATSPARAQVKGTVGVKPQSRRQSKTNPGTAAAPVSNSAPAKGFDLSQIQQLIEEGQDVQAYEILADAYVQVPSQRPAFQKELDELAQRIYFSPQPQLQPPYEIQPGDQLRKIANKYQLSWQYLSRLNQVDARKIRPGKTLKVFQGPFEARVDLSDFELVVLLNGKFVKRYSVGTGKMNSSPIGEFTVREKLENPTYYGPNGMVLDADDPMNPLGERWIDIGNSFGIHGTIEPDSIGKSESAGCIRMRNEEVEEVYDLLTIGSQVRIQR